jgi:hypothetical protein
MRVPTQFAADARDERNTQRDSQGMRDIDNIVLLLIGWSYRTQRYNRGEVMADNITPASVFKTPEKVEAAKYHRDIVRARAEGVAEGRTLARKEVIDFLQEKYMAPDAPERGSDDAQFMLKLTRELTQFMMGKARRWEIPSFGWW